MIANLRARVSATAIATATLTILSVPPASARPASGNAAAASPASQDVPPSAPADDAGAVNDVVVTGSRIASNGNNAPTPLTTVSTDLLQATTPTNLPDALNKLPAFAGSRSPRTTGGATISWPGNFLNLRNLMPNRVLILLDGRRVPATDANGQVNVDILPQSLVRQVDVVTGGASAVYGSDAVAGVVNFVLDKKFTGILASGQAGISEYGDAKSWRAEITAGTGFAGGRGHVEASYEHFNSDGVTSMLSRPGGKDAYQEAGNGSAANPYRRVADVRNTSLTPGGYIASGPLANMTFGSNGTLTRFTHGQSLGGSLEIGGDGGWSGLGASLFPGVDNNPWLTASLKTDRFFGRADFDVTDTINLFVQGNYSRSENYNISNTKSVSATFAIDNAYLPQTARDLLAAGGASSFTMSRGLFAQTGDVSQGITQNYMVTVGASGRLFDRGPAFELYYTHGRSQFRSRSPGTTNNERLFAALDAVVGPNGTVVCRSSLNALGASRFPGCQPFNAFGPSSESASAFDYVTETMQFDQINVLDNVGATLSGSVLDGWAGPIRAAASVEYRNVSLQVDSAFSPTARVDCSGLNPVTCSPSRVLYSSAVAALPRVSEGVIETAVEAELPLLRDLPLVRSLDLNAAARFTRYDISGGVTTWKVGAVWQVFDDLRIRATRSRDIRAPNLNDLYAPTNQNFTAFTDLLTQTTANTLTVSRGNPDLTPEKADTLTVGAVYTPSWARGLSMSVDYYDIRINDVITTVSGGSAPAQRICIASGGTSSYCSLVERPFPITNTSPDNFPTAIISSGLNTGYVTTHGIDAELGYSTSAPGLFAGSPGKLGFRVLYSYQPVYRSFTGIPGAPILNAAGAQGFFFGIFSFPAHRATAFTTYDTGPLSTNLQARFGSATRNNADPSLIYREGNIPAYVYLDLGARYRLGKGANAGDRNGAELFVSIQNLLDRKPSIWTGTFGAPGYSYPAPRDQDAIGRYFTGGVRVRF